MMISGCYQEAWLAGSNRSLISGRGGRLYIYGKNRCMRWQKYPRSLARDEILVLFSSANAIYRQGELWSYTGIKRTGIAKKRYLRLSLLLWPYAFYYQPQPLYHKTKSFVLLPLVSSKTKSRVII